MSRPKIKIEPDRFDWTLEIIGAIFLLLMIGLPLYYFNKLPDSIPIHFNAAGEAEGFGQRSMIWVLPSLGLVMYIALLFLNRYPHIFNYPKAITEENAERQYRIATKLIRSINVITVGSFFYIGYATIQTALNNQDGLRPYFLPVLLIVVLGTISTYLYRAFAKK